MERWTALDRAVKLAGNGQIDPAMGAMLGNVPQALSHSALIHADVAVPEGEKRRSRQPTKTWIALAPRAKCSRAAGSHAAGGTFMGSTGARRSPG